VNSLSTKDPSILLRLYESIVRPHLEYCSPAWSPKYGKDKELLERIQHRFTRFFNDLRDLDYAERLRRLGLWTLEERRNRADLIELYKIVNGLSNLPVSTFFEFRTDTRTRGHSLKLNKRRSNRDLRLHFFSERVVNRWNQLRTVKCTGGNFCKFIQGTSADTQNYGDRLLYGHIMSD